MYLCVYTYVRKLPGSPLTPELLRSTAAHVSREQFLVSLCSMLVTALTPTLHQGACVTPEPGGPTPAPPQHLILRTRLGRRV